jgi:hypothetical protein
VGLAAPCFSTLPSSHASCLLNDSPSPPSSLLVDDANGVRANPAVV